MNGLGIIACIIGAATMWIPFKRAGAHLSLAWRNPAWNEDIQNLRFLSACGAIAFCVIAGFLAARMLGS